ncbi:Calcineurin-like phosphoesterase domain, ApaH type [uncultured Caudovirales phage]|uniref:Calcineurin-like phosphoesterase domain, ApaH type n=1 Tax=uncultured Caudovirales phage TaxID=2100421 RepID=A0A6J5QWD4_9CAUD|nr:Calcineurin-like phosphoesterase domain, ApaH type [uncultured Caudovirales phage]
MSKPTKFVFASDSHGDMADEESLQALYAYCKDFKPDIRIAGGDHFDLRSIRKGAMGDAEGAESLKEDLDCGIDFLHKFRPTYYLKGNHEYRLEHMKKTHASALVRDYCSDTEDKIDREARRSGVKRILPYHGKRGLLRIGPISSHHGIGTNLTKLGMHYATEGGLFMCGHGHTGHQVNLPKHNGGAAYMAPCLCRIDDMEYAANYLGTARWNNGFIAGWYSDNDWKAWIIHRIGKKWLWQSDLTVWTPPNKRR